MREAVRGADCVIHCAGKTKAVRAAEYDAVNLEGTRNVVRAVNAEKATVKHLVHISSLAANHPAGADSPALETDAPRPVSEYGRSKLRAEELVRESCEAPFTILRPAAVYGPRDADFLPVFKAVRRHLMPLIGGGRMQLSLVYVGDVAAAALRCLGNPQAYGKTYHVASPEPCTTRDFLREIAAAMNVRAVPVSIPLALLYPVALGAGSPRARHGQAEHPQPPEAQGDEGARLGLLHGPDPARPPIHGRHAPSRRHRKDDHLV